MAEMNQAMAVSRRRQPPPTDAGGFAAEIEKHADTLANSGWLSEAGNLRQWASELRGKSLRTALARDLLPGSSD